MKLNPKDEQGKVDSTLVSFFVEENVEDEEGEKKDENSDEQFFTIIKKTPDPRVQVNLHTSLARGNLQ